MVIYFAGGGYASCDFDMVRKMIKTEGSWNQLVSYFGETSRFIKCFNLMDDVEKEEYESRKK